MHHQAAQSKEMSICTSKYIPSHSNVPATYLEPSVCSPARTCVILMQSSYMYLPDRSINASPSRSKIAVCSSVDSARLVHHQAAQSEEIRICTSKCIPSRCYLVASCLEPSVCSPARTGVILMQTSYICWPDQSSNTGPADPNLLPKLRCAVQWTVPDWYTIRQLN